MLESYSLCGSEILESRIKWLARRNLAKRDGDSMNEFDEADFPGIYSGETLMKTVDIKRIPWDVGHSQDVVKEAFEGMAMEDLLDVGCGTGENAEYIASQGVRVTAIDFSADAIKRACERHPSSTVSYKHHDIFQIEESWRGNFDAILDSATYHAIPSVDRLRYLEVLYSYLRPGGKLTTITFAEHPKGMPAKLAVKQDALCENLYKSGFSDVTVSLGFYHGVYDSIEELIKEYELDIDRNQYGESILPVWVAKASKADS